VSHTLDEQLHDHRHRHRCHHRHSPGRALRVSLGQGEGGDHCSSQLVMSKQWERGVHHWWMGLIHLVVVSLSLQVDSHSPLVDSHQFLCDEREYPVSLTGNSTALDHHPHSECSRAHSHKRNSFAGHHCHQFGDCCHP
jgi:hypothetical protein